MKIEEITISNLVENIENAESVDYLLAMRRSFVRREDMTDGERQYYSVIIKRRIDYLFNDFR